MYVAIAYDTYTLYILLCTYVYSLLVHLADTCTHETDSTQHFLF